MFYPRSQAYSFLYLANARVHKSPPFCCAFSLQHVLLKEPGLEHSKQKITSPVLELINYATILMHCLLQHVLPKEPGLQLAYLASARVVHELPPFCWGSFLLQHILPKEPGLQHSTQGFFT
jgi:hypothetical protein